MTVSVRMDVLLEKELELAARRQGVTKSQFIISAVERALGRKSPAAIYHQVMEEAARYTVDEGARDDDLPSHKAVLRENLRKAREQQQDDYAAYLAQREAATKEPS